MAEVTLPKFEIVPDVAYGQDLQGNPKTYSVKTCRVTTDEVKSALRQIGTAYPELADTMRVAIALQVRLDTIRDEAKLQALGIRRKAREAMATDALEHADQLIASLGTWEQTHSLYL